jgi:hypothetical protein
MVMVVFLGDEAQRGGGGTAGLAESVLLLRSSGPFASHAKSKQAGCNYSTVDAGLVDDPA